MNAMTSTRRGTSRKDKVAFDADLLTRQVDFQATQCSHARGPGAVSGHWHMVGACGSMDRREGCMLCQSTVLCDGKPFSQFFVVVSVVMAVLTKTGEGDGINCSLLSKEKATLRSDHLRRIASYTLSGDEEKAIALLSFCYLKVSRFFF